MTNFKEHWLIFKMLDKPVPLIPDTELPVLVRLIQDDTMLGKANKTKLDKETCELVEGLLKSQEEER